MIEELVCLISNGKTLPKACQLLINAVTGEVPKRLPVAARRDEESDSAAVGEPLETSCVGLTEWLK